MKAIVCEKSGPVEGLRLKDVEKPVPKDNEVLVKVHAATVTSGDVWLRKLHPLLLIPMSLLGLKRKPIPGHEFSGVVEAVGSKVSEYQPGQRVVGTTSGLSVGANGEYLCMPVDAKSGKLLALPDKISFEQAAALPVGAMTALFLLRKGKIDKGQRVLVYGASGSVGTFAVQLAKHFGAEVTGVCSGANLEMVSSLGADHVIDYTSQDITASGEQYDLVFDAVGKLAGEASKKLLAPGGALVSIKSMTSPSREDLAMLLDLMAAGKLRAVIDRRYPLAETAEAHRYVESGRKKGNVVITVVPA